MNATAAVKVVSFYVLFEQFITGQFTFGIFIYS